MTSLKKIMSVALLFVATVASAQDITGYWKGNIAAGNSQLELCFDITKSGGEYKATLDVPQQAVFNLPVSSVSFDGMNLTISITQMNAEYSGQLVINSFMGKFSQKGITFDLNLAKGERMKFTRSQQVVRPVPYHEDEVKFKNTREGITLAGTLTTPQGNGPFPAVVLISGSGTQDRNEELLDHKPFEVIADYLTRNGIAVLRYDDRGAGESEKGKKGSTSLDLSYDAEAAFEYLKADPDIDHSKIGLIGHSEGGIINYMVAARRNDVGFLISLAGPAVKGAKLLRVQQTLNLMESGLTKEQAETAYGFYDEIFEKIIESSELNDALTTDVRAILKKSEVPDQMAAEVVKQICEPWMYYFLRFDPTDNIVKVNCPALLLNGNKDVQVASFQNLSAYRKIAEEHGKTNMTIREMKDLNHLFQHCQTGSTREYAVIEETVSPEVLQIIVDYIKNLK